MALPDKSQPWPPPEVADANHLFARYGAWYAGDPIQLAEIYGATGGFGDLGSELPKGQPNAPRFVSGLRHRLQRRFWGTVEGPTQYKSTKLHIPLPADIAMTSADLLFGEPPKLELPSAADGKPSAAQDRLNDILDEANIHAVLLEGGETGAYAGGYYLRARWDPVLAKCPLFDVVPPDAAVPEFRGGRLVAVTFWRYLARIDARTWRHLERHEVVNGAGVVLHGVYASNDADKLGRPMALTDHPETAPLAELVKASGSGDGQTIVTGASGLAVEFVPNMLPNRDLRGSAIGRSDYAGVEPVFDALDESWTSWMRDLRLGKGRMVVPRSYVQNLGRGRGAVFDADREVFEAVDAVPSADGGLQLSVVQFAIRVEEHARTCHELTEKALASAGYSPQTFGESDQIAATATEVTTREQASYRTRSRKILYTKGPLARIALAALEIDVKQFGTKITPERPSVQFPDGVAQDQQALGQVLQLLAAAEAASIETRVRLWNPDWPEDKVTAEVARIKDETAKAGPITLAPPGGAGAPGQGPDGPAIPNVPDNNATADKASGVPLPARAGT